MSNSIILIILLLNTLQYVKSRNVCVKHQVWQNGINIRSTKHQHFQMQWTSTTSNSANRQAFQAFNLKSSKGFSPLATTWFSTHFTSINSIHSWADIGAIDAQSADNASLSKELISCETHLQYDTEMTITIDTISRESEQKKERVDNFIRNGKSLGTLLTYMSEQT